MTDVITGIPNIVLISGLAFGGYLLFADGDDDIFEPEDMEDE